MRGLYEYESATQELQEYLGRKDFRVMWDAKTRKYEVQQRISEGWDEIPLVLNGSLTHLFYPCFFWSTILIAKTWHAGIKREVHWGLVVPAKEILDTMRRREQEIERDDARRTSDMAHETAKWMWQATPHKRLYSTAQGGDMP